MNCEKFEDIVSDLARSRMMEVDMRLEALAHSDKCGECGSRLLEQEKLSSALDALKGTTQSESGSNKVPLRVLEAFRTAGVVHPIAPGRSKTAYWLTAAAAVLLIFSGVATVRWHRENGQQSAVQETDKLESKNEDSRGIIRGEPLKKIDDQVVNPSGGKRKTTGVVAKGRLPRIYRADRAASASANHVVKEVTTEFMLLGDLGVANLQDGGQIVRVELPRSALVPFGIPVNMDRYEEKVKADVLLGIDGSAHAIRFVQ